MTSYSQVAKAIESGEAVEVINNEEFGVTGGAGFITRPDVLADPEKLAAAKDFFGR